MAIRPFPRGHHENWPLANPNLSHLLHLSNNFSTTTILSSNSPKTSHFPYDAHMTKHHLSRYSTSQQKDINLFRLRLQVTTLALPWQAYHSTKELQSTHFYTKAIATLHAPPLSDVPGNLIKFKVGFKKKTTSKANARYLPGNFVRQLEEKVEEFTKSDDAENFIGSLKFKEAKTQADPRIAYRAAKGLTDAIMSADSDFAAYVGTDGLCLKDWHYSSQ